MTGFGKAICELTNKKIIIEIKSLNSKQIDIYSRLPGLYKEKDIYIRNLISSKLFRGKIDVSIHIDSADIGRDSIINKELVKSYFKQLVDVSDDLGVNDKSDLFSVVMRLPDVLKQEKEELNEEEWNTIKNSIEDALDNLILFRQQEGVVLKKDIEQRIVAILKLQEELEPFEKERIVKIKEKLKNSLKEIDNDEYDKNRLEQELIYYLEKLDITEEKIRLAHHCNFFLKTIELEEPVGKKLGFISQEIGREINTLGSKANNSDMQKIVIAMKDELEKVKEQVLNIL